MNSPHSTLKVAVLNVFNKFTAYLTFFINFCVDVDSRFIWLLKLVAIVPLGIKSNQILLIEPLIRREAFCQKWLVCSGLILTNSQHQSLLHLFSEANEIILSINYKRRDVA